MSESDVRSLFDWISWRREAAHWRHCRRSLSLYCRRWSLYHRHPNRGVGLSGNTAKILNQKEESRRIYDI